jgi:hypothetical protein
MVVSPRVHYCVLCGLSTNDVMSVLMIAKASWEAGMKGATAMTWCAFAVALCDEQS